MVDTLWLKSTDQCFHPRSQEEIHPYVDTEKSLFVPQSQKVSYCTGCTIIEVGLAINFRIL